MHYKLFWREYRDLTWILSEKFIRGDMGRGWEARRWEVNGDHNSNRPSDPLEGG